MFCSRDVVPQGLKVMKDDLRAVKKIKPQTHTQPTFENVPPVSPLENIMSSVTSQRHCRGTGAGAQTHRGWFNFRVLGFFKTPRVHLLTHTHTVIYETRVCKKTCSAPSSVYEHEWFWCCCLVVCQRLKKQKHFIMSTWCKWSSASDGDQVSGAQCVGVGVLLFSDFKIKMNKE